MKASICIPSGQAAVSYLALGTWSSTVTGLQADYVYNMTECVFIFLMFPKLWVNVLYLSWNILRYLLLSQLQL